MNDDVKAVRDGLIRGYMDTGPQGGSTGPCFFSVELETLQRILDNHEAMEKALEKIADSGIIYYGVHQNAASAVLRKVRGKKK